MPCALPVGGRERAALVKNDGGLRHFNKVQRVYGSVAASGAHPVNGLRILQIRIHASRRFDEPRAKMRRRMRGEVASLRKRPRGGKCRRLNAQSNQQQAMRIEIAWIGFTIRLM